MLRRRFQLPAQLFFLQTVIMTLHLMNAKKIACRRDQKVSYSQVPCVPVRFCGGENHRVFKVCFLKSGYALRTVS